MINPDSWDTINAWYYIAGATISVMLIISEALAWWPGCKANAITQLYKCIDCISTNPEQEEVHVPE